GEGVAAAAEDVARDLVQQQHQRQRAVSIAHPVVVFAAGGGEVRILPASAAFGVERLAAAEPLGHAGLAPERQQRLRGGGAHSSNLRCRTDLPWRRISLSASMPTLMWFCT